MTERSHQEFTTASHVIIALAGLSLACAVESSEERLAAPFHRATIDLEIGVTDGADPYVFGAITGLALDARGRIYVADGQASEIRAFNSDGSFAHLVAARGAGPGEVAVPCCLAMDPNGDLWVRDTRNSRYNRYDVSGAEPHYAGTILIQFGSGGYWAPPSFDADGKPVDVVSSGGQMMRYHLSSDGEIADTDVIEVPPPDSLGEFTVERVINGRRAVAYIHQPHGPRHLVAHGPGGEWAEAVSSRYHIRWIGPRDTTTIDASVEAPLLSSRERAEAEHTLNEDLNRWRIRRDDVDIEIPARKPPLAALSLSNDGLLWAFLTAADGAQRRAHVYASGGRHAATIEWPADVTLHDGFIGNGVALGVRQDSLDVPHVIRLRFPPIN